jgi:hypothetical protein
LTSSHLFHSLNRKAGQAQTNTALWAERAQAIYDGCQSKQRALLDSVENGYKYLGLRCPRRAGKTYGFASLALRHGEKHPNSRILIVSLTLKSVRDNYWSGAPGGIFALNEKYGLGLKFNHTYNTWQHENGSRGQLVGAETLADIEKIRGSLAEADIAIVDECKSFAPELFLQLLRDVLLPGLMTRDGALAVGGTPGSIPMGMFYEATCPTARTEYTCPKCEKTHPTCIPVGDEASELYACPELEKAALWRLHSWTIQDNPRSDAWKRALQEKLRNQWPDDHPPWRREYLGEWVTDATDLVYHWANYKDRQDYVTWRPERTRKNPSGLPVELGPWRYVLGIDLGYVDDTALVLCAYSEVSKELRHVYDFKQPGMTIDAFMDEVFSVIERFGRPDSIVADTAGGGSKMLIESMNQRYGLGIEPAKKTEKMDHIEMVNSDFSLGRIKIIPGSDLAIELGGLQWDLSRESKAILSRTGRLKEDPQCPNHLCDALLYLHRYSYHHWSSPPPMRTTPGTPEWLREMEAAELEKAMAKRTEAKKDPHGLRRYEKGLPWTR